MTTSTNSQKIGRKERNESNGSSASPSLQRDSKGKPIHQKKGRWSFNNSCLEILVPVILWYILGVLSISTTKIILTDYEHIGITPLFITVQQLLIGIFFLRLWIFCKNRVPPYPIPFRKMLSLRKANSDYLGYVQLFLSATFFSLGFWLTNLSFAGADASFVETIKASEPISSASLAVWYGLECMSSKEVYSLIGICVGVVVSTLGNAHEDASVRVDDFISDPGNKALIRAVCSCGIVLGANLCFSFRGLYQKLFRRSPNGSKALVDDLNLQYRVHQMGLIVMIIPFLYEVPAYVRLWLHDSAGGFLSREELQKFVVLTVVNGFAFTHYK
jgi:drug/metabolite transporter (DMT)-like permease